MRHKPETIVYAAGWLESQFEAWKEKAADETTKKVFTEAEEMFKTVSEGVIDLVARVRELEGQIEVVKSAFPKTWA